jgi:hypothetical protein
MARDSYRISYSRILVSPHVGTITDEQTERLTAISRSRSEPASRVVRAQMLLAYRENPSFYAVGKKDWEFTIRQSTAASSGRWHLIL